MRPIQESIQKQVIHELRQGKSIHKVAKQFDLSSSTVHKYGSGIKTEIPKNVGGGVSKLSARDKAFCV
jgi:transposase